MNTLTKTARESGSETVSFGTPELFGQVSDHVAWLMERHAEGREPESSVLDAGWYELRRTDIVESVERVRLDFPEGQTGRVSLRRGEVRMDGANSGIIAIGRGRVVTEENSGKMAISGPGALVTDSVRAVWNAGSFPLGHAAFNHFLAWYMSSMAAMDTGGLDFPDPEGNVAAENLRRRTFGMYRSYGADRLDNLYDSRYLFAQHRLTVEADGCTLRADLQARVLRDADGREVTLGHEPVRVGPFEAAIGQWGAPQIYHRGSGQLVRIGFTADAHRGRVLVMEHRT